MQGRSEEAAAECLNRGATKLLVDLTAPFSDSSITALLTRWSREAQLNERQGLRSRSAIPAHVVRALV